MSSIELKRISPCISTTRARLVSLMVPAQVVPMTVTVAALPGWAVKATRLVPQPESSSADNITTHAPFTLATTVPVYFCNPKSPCSATRNENASGFVRQNLPHGVVMRDSAHADLDAIVCLDVAASPVRTSLLVPFSR